MKCETPARASGSSREPAPIQKPSATERTPVTRSEMTRSPAASSLSWCFDTPRDRTAGPWAAHLTNGARLHDRRSTADGVLPGTSEAATLYMSVVPESRPESVKLSRPFGLPTCSTLRRLEPDPAHRRWVE